MEFHIHRIDQAMFKVCSNSNTSISGYQFSLDAMNFDIIEVMPGNDAIQAGMENLIAPTNQQLFLVIQEISYQAHQILHWLLFEVIIQMLMVWLKLFLLMVKMVL